MTGGSLFIFLGIVFTLYFRTYRVLDFLIISFPLFIVGMLFIIFYVLTKKKSL